jgi:hypothetical protein
MELIVGIFALVLFFVALVMIIREGNSSSKDQPHSSKPTQNTPRKSTNPDSQKQSSQGLLPPSQNNYPKLSARENLQKQADAKNTHLDEVKRHKPDKNTDPLKSNQSDTATKHDGFNADSELDISSIPNDLFMTLVRKVNGQENVARRLIQGNIRLDKSLTWSCEKAISDLERDRR